jgi:hypothetical protein
MISHALIGGREIGVTVDEIPFGVDAAIEVRHADVYRCSALASTDTSPRSKPTV